MGDNGQGEPAPMTVQHYQYASAAGNCETPDPLLKTS